MTSYLDVNKLAKLVRNKRANRGLREVVKEIDNVSASTISRVENGKTPDIETFLALCDWLGLPPAEFIKNTEEIETVTASEAIAIQILADPKLDPAVAKVLAALVKVVYQDLV